MTLDQIYYFIEIVKTGSMSQTAKNLHVSQPNISMTIGALEKELGYRLFNRLPKGVELTRQGAEFLHHAESIASNVDGIKRICQKDQDNVVDFSVSAQFSSSCVHAILEMLYFFDKDKKTLTVRQSPFWDVVTSVEHGHSNLGLLSISIDQKNFITSLLEKKGLEFILLDRPQMAIGIPKGHPLYEYKSLNLSDLKAYPLVLVEHSDKDYLSVEPMKKLEIDSFESKIIVQDIFLFYHLLLASNGVTFLSTSKNHDISHTLKIYNMDLKIFPLEDPVMLEFGYIKPKSRPLNFAEQYFIKSLELFYQDLQ